jgi:hypothetical protein
MTKTGVTALLTTVPVMVTSRSSAHREGRQPVTPTDGAGAVAAGGVRRSCPRAAWASSRPARDRTAGCLLHWCRRGSSRLHPVIPGSAAQAELGCIIPASRRGAPDGVRSHLPGRGRACSSRRGNRKWMRRSALRFPCFLRLPCVRGEILRSRWSHVRKVRAGAFFHVAALAPRDDGLRRSSVQSAHSNLPRRSYIKLP